jgi:predicted dehydrogenase
MSDRIRLGMVGGGQGAFIGAVHRIAARIDDHYDLVAGALSSEPARAHASAAEIGIAADRSYDDYAAMAAGEAARDDGIEAVAIVTPNHMHFEPAKAFLEAGIHVICDKPLTHKLEDAEALEKIANASGKHFILTHNYSGYPMTRHARQMVAEGELGDIRVVQVEYPQDWLSDALEDTGQKQASWRTDPERSGAGGCIGDIGTHAYHIARFVTGLELDKLSADLATMVEGRSLDDNVNIMLRFQGGARGMLWASQVAPGNLNALRLRVYGTKGGLEWSQEEPNTLWFTPLGAPKRMICRGGPGAGSEAERMTRIPGGHPEGYLEGFANIYTEAAAAIRASRDGKLTTPDGVYFPTVADGVEGMRFIAAAIASSNADGKWTGL